jgi:hypothetical protein
MCRIKLSIFFLFFGLLQAVFPSSFFNVLEQTRESVVVEWTAPELQWQAVALPDGNYYLPQMGDLPLSREPGEPQLPFDSFSPPLSGEGVRITVLDSVYEIRSSPRICPTPVESDSADASRIMTQESAASRSSFFNQTSFMQYNRGRTRGIFLHRLQINPLKYNSATEQIQFLRYMKIRISVTTKEPSANMRTTAVPKSSLLSAPLPGLKIYTLKEGVYQISGADLLNSGVNPASIDPHLLRIENKGKTLPCWVVGEDDGQFDAADRLFFYAERLAGDGQFYHAYTDTNVFWLRWDQAGARFSSVESGSGETIDTSFPESLHFEKDLEYYNGDSNADIQESDVVPGEGWVWDSAIDPGDFFQATFTLPGFSSSSDSAWLQFRVRGETVDSYLNSHHLRLRLNQNLVYDGFFDDREERVIRVGLKSSVLNESDNLLEIESLRDNPNVSSRFYFDWFQVEYQRKMIAQDGFLRLTALKSEERLYWAQGFDSPNIHIWDVENHLALTPRAVGREWLSEIQVSSAGLADGNFARFNVNGQLIFNGSRGISIVALDSNTGQTLFQRSFDTYASAAQSDTLAFMIQSLPDSAVVLAATMDDGATNLRSNAIEALQSVGSQQIGQLKYRDSWALIGRKGVSQPIAEQLSPQGSGAAQASKQLVFTGNAGYHAQFSVPPGVGGSLIVFDEAAALSPLRLKYIPQNGVSAFTGADYLIVTHKRFTDQAARLARYRETHNGFSTFVADIEDIYDAFNFGLPDAEALRDFLRFAYETGKPSPAYILLFGDATWDPKNNLVNSINKNYVPTLGNPVSDALLVCFDGADDVLPEISIGRIPVKNEAEAEAAVNKIIEYEQAPSAAWKKNFLFISGGFDAVEQQQFKTQSDNLASEFAVPPPTYGQPLFISKVLENPDADYRSVILETINNGVLWSNFIGHAASRTWELMFNTPDIEDLANKGRYPFVTSMTCHTGRFAEPTQDSFSEHFLLLPDKGAIGFWGTSGWGYSYEDYLYLCQIYPTVTADSLRFLGDIVKTAKVKLWQRYGPGGHYRNLSLQYNLLGDPAVQLTLPRQPDLALQPQDIAVFPQSPSEGDSTAIVRANVENWGIGFKDSVDVELTIQNTVNDKIIVQSRRIAPVGLSQNVEFNFPLHDMAGVVELTVNLDPSNRIAEFDESNNRQTNRVTVLTSDLQLVSPPQNAMMPLAGIELKVQAPQQQFNEDDRYIFEIDTTRSFSSSLLRTSPPIRTHPLLIRWTPDNLLARQRYYWRVHRDGDESEPFPFTATFLTTADETFGWAQDSDADHKNTYENTEWREGGFALSPQSIPLVIQSSRNDQGGYALIEVNKRLAMTTARGHNVVVLDQHTGEIKVSGSFDTYGDANAPKELAALIQSVKKGDYVLSAISEEGGINLTDEVYAAYESIGSALCRQIQFRSAWAILGRKGASIGSAAEGLQPMGGPAVILKDTLQVLSPSGRMVSLKIGPASAWKNAQISCVVPDSAVFAWSVFGYSVSGAAQTLLAADESQIDLSSIDARQYPFLSLVGSFNSYNGANSPQLRQWDVEYSPVPDLALSPHLFAQTADSVVVGQSVRFYLDVYNIGLLKADSAIVRFERDDEAHGRVRLTDIRLDSIAVDKYRPLEYKWTAGPQAGNIRFTITVDPDLAISELNEANNSIITEVFVLSDTQPPQVRLTFDDREIFDGDLVAARPTIIAKIMDNNPEPIVDTTRVSVLLDSRRISFLNSTELSLTSVTEPEVRGALHFTPSLSQGEHLLEIQVADAGYNQMISRMHFVVEENLVLRQLLNYPNPFAESTEFCFEISQPAEVSVKIFTIAGRLIRTLEGGWTPVGYNKLFWDGRDQDGDALANGVYIYKMTAANDEKSVQSINKLTVMR